MSGREREANRSGTGQVLIVLGSKIKEEGGRVGAGSAPVSRVVREGATETVTAEHWPERRDSHAGARREGTKTPHEPGVFGDQLAAVRPAWKQWGWWGQSSPGPDGVQGLEALRGSRLLSRGGKCRTGFSRSPCCAEWTVVEKGTGGRKLLQCPRRGCWWPGLGGTAVERGGQIRDRCWGWGVASEGSGGVRFQGLYLST